MADTERSFTTLIGTNFADGQVAGSITPQDHRDMLVSMRDAFGRISMTALPNTTATTIGNTTDYFAVSGTTAIASMVQSFDQPANGRLRYTGTASRHMHIAASISYKAAAANQDVLFQIWHYDASAAGYTALTSSTIGDRISTTTETTAIHADAMMDTNDYLELRVRNTTAANNVTVEYFYLFALGMLT